MSIDCKVQEIIPMLLQSALGGPQLCPAQFRILHLRKNVDQLEMNQIKLIGGLGNWSQSRTGGNRVNMSCSKGGKDFVHDNIVQRCKSLLCTNLFAKAMVEKEQWFSTVGLLNIRKTL